MTTPTTNRIREHALKIFYQENPEKLSITPEDNELKESGYWKQAANYLMYNPSEITQATNEYKNHLEKEVNDIGLRIVTPQQENTILEVEQTKQENKQNKSLIHQLTEKLKSLMQPKQQLELEKPQYKEPSISTDTLSSQLQPQPFTVDTHELMTTGICVLGTRQSGKTNTAKHIVKQLINEGKIVFIIDPTQVWQKDYPQIPIVTLQEPHGPTRISWNLETTIFDTSQLSPKQQQQFIELFSIAVFMRAVNTDVPWRPQIVCVFEEAHTPMPLNRLGAKQYQNTTRLITQGANFNVSFIAITQFSSMIDKLPVKAAQQRYFGKTSEPNDLKYLRAYLGENVKQLPTLRLGEFLYMHTGKLSKIQTTRFEDSQTMTYQYQFGKTTSLQKISREPSETTLKYHSENRIGETQ